jgi:hypothetical protein
MEARNEQRPERALRNSNMLHHFKQQLPETHFAVLFIYLFIIFYKLQYFSFMLEKKRKLFNYAIYSFFES